MGNLHLKDVVDQWVVLHFVQGQERHGVSLECAKSTFDFSFGLGARSDEVGDPKTFECTLEVNFGIAFFVGICNRFRGMGNLPNSTSFLPDSPHSSGLNP